MCYEANFFCSLWDNLFKLDMAIGYVLAFGIRIILGLKRDIQNIECYNEINLIFGYFGLVSLTGWSFIIYGEIKLRGSLL